MTGTRAYDQRQAEFRKFTTEAYPELKALKASGQKEAFNAKLLSVMPEVKRYLTRGLRLALAKGQISHNKYRPDDLFDQLFLEVYDQIETVPTAEQFHPWLFKKAEKLLSDLEMDEIFNAYLYESLERYSQAERRGMDESFSTDGDGDLIMMDELDDISYRDPSSLLTNIFLDDAHEDLMAMTEGNTGQAKVSRHLDTILFTLPASMRSIFELSGEQGFSIAEIAKIKKRSEAEIETLLDEARDLMRRSLKERLSKS